MGACNFTITHSAYREMETVPSTPLSYIREAIFQLSDDPFLSGSGVVQGIGGCRYLAIDNYYILYHLDEDKLLTVLGVLYGSYHPLQ